MLLPHFLCVLVNCGGHVVSVPIGLLGTSREVYCVVESGLVLVLHVCPRDATFWCVFPDGSPEHGRFGS